MVISDSPVYSPVDADKSSISNELKKMKSEIESNLMKEMKEVIQLTLEKSLKSNFQPPPQQTIPPVFSNYYPGQSKYKLTNNTGQRPMEVHYHLHQNGSEEVRSTNGGSGGPFGSGEGQRMGNQRSIWPYFPNYDQNQFY